MINDDWPIGMLPDGSLNICSADDPVFQPTVVKDEGRPTARRDESNVVRVEPDIRLESGWKILIKEIQRLQALAAHSAPGRDG